MAEPTNAQRIAAKLTEAQRIVLPLFPTHDGWFSAPTICGRRAGNLASALWTKGVFALRYEKGLYWYQWTPLGRQVLAEVRGIREARRG